MTVKEIREKETEHLSNELAEKRPRRVIQISTTMTQTPISMWVAWMPVMMK